MLGGVHPAPGGQLAQAVELLSVVALSQTFADIWECEFSNCSVHDSQPVCGCVATGGLGPMPSTQCVRAATTWRRHVRFHKTWYAGELSADIRNVIPLASILLATEVASVCARLLLGATGRHTLSHSGGAVTKSCCTKSSLGMWPTWTLFCAHLHMPCKRLLVERATAVAALAQAAQKPSS